MVFSGINEFKEVSILDEVIAIIKNVHNSFALGTCITLYQIIMSVSSGIFAPA